MNNNKQALRTFSYVLKNQKKQFIWKHIVLYKCVIIGGLLILGLGAIFGELFHNIFAFLVNFMIQLILLIVIGFVEGVLSFEVYKEMATAEVWTKKLKWKYILAEGIIGFGLFCGVATQDFYPFKEHTWLLVIINLVVFAISGLGFGVFMQLFWKQDNIRAVCKQINTKE